MTDLTIVVNSRRWSAAVGRDLIVQHSPMNSLWLAACSANSESVASAGGLGCRLSLYASGARAYGIGVARAVCNQQAQWGFVCSLPTHLPCS